MYGATAVKYVNTGISAARGSRLWNMAVKYSYYFVSYYFVSYYFVNTGGCHTIHTQPDYYCYYYKQYLLLHTI